MDMDSLKRGQVIAAQLQKIDAAIDGCNEFINKIDMKHERVTDLSVNPIGKYYHGRVSEHPDDSGGYIELDGTGVVEDVIAATFQILTRKKAELEREFAEL